MSEPERAELFHKGTKAEPVPLLMDFFPNWDWPHSVLLQNELDSAVMLQKVKHVLQYCFRECRI